MMHRRALLATLGAGISAFSGCSGRSGSSSTQPQSTTGSAASSTDKPAFDPNGRAETIRVGTNPGEIIPHGVVVWNARESSTRVNIRIFDAAAGETRHEKTHELPADIAIAITLRAPSRYQISLRVSELDVQRTISVSERLFDTCNDSYTHVSIRETGLTERTMMTELACITTTDH